MKATATKRGNVTAARTLADTRTGLRRVGVLLDEMRNSLCEQGERGAVIRLALHDAASIKPKVPIIMLTANTDEQVGRTTPRWGGAFDYVAKPFETAHLVGVVAAAVVHSRAE